MKSSALRIAIVGGGIGGLTLALALRQRGLEAEVFEQARELTEIGAGVALSANGIRELARLGLLEQLCAVATEPTELIYRRWQDGRRIAAHPIRRASRYRSRFGAPYLGIHRKDLQRILTEAYGTSTLHLAHRLTDLIEQQDGMTLSFSNGRVVYADLVVGADGARSMVRRWVSGDERTRYSGASGFRGIVAVEQLRSLPDPHAIQFWMGPNAHLLHYPIGPKGDAINFLAVVEEPSMWPRADSWTMEVQGAEPLAAFAGWHAAVTEMIGAVSHEVRWALFAVRPLRHWHRARAVLIGDAAHGMLPHQGQGANTAIEDAITLAELLADVNATSDIGAVLQRYHALRRVRTRQIQHSSWVTNHLLHLPDHADALADRDARVAAFPEKFSWIHEFDALRSVRTGGNEQCWV